MMMMNEKQKLATLGLLCLLVTGCGGGSDNPSPPPPPPPPATAEGFWNGTISTGYGVSLAVLENGDTWGVYTSSGYIYGALFGHTTSSGNQLSGSGLVFDIPSRTVQSASYTGSVTAKRSLNVRASNGVTFTTSYDSSYDQPPPSLSTIAGSYSGSAVTGTTLPQTITVTISSSGAVTMPTTLGCGATGTVQPRASGKNVFDLTVRFQGSTCALGNGATVQGVAVADGHTLLALTLNNAKSDGFIYTASK